jgi:hypothetical protein
MTAENCLSWGPDRAVSATAGGNQNLRRRRSCEGSGSHDLLFRAALGRLCRHLPDGGVDRVYELLSFHGLTGGRLSPLSNARRLSIWK